MKRLSFIIYHLTFSAAFLALVSCLGDDDSHNSGFYFNKPAHPINTIYANTVQDSVCFWSYGRWSLSVSGESPWCTVALNRGNGNTLYGFIAAFEPNTTGSGRSAVLNFTDTDYPGDGKASLYYWQYATRGDGTLGAAPDVKRISGTDGSLAELAYDAQHRPTSLRLSKDGATQRTLTLDYFDRDSLLTVTDNGRRLTSFYGADFQPYKLRGENDTVGYASQYYTNGMQVSANYAFNYEHRSAGGNHTIHAYRLNGQNLAPDSLHCADSLRLATMVSGSTEVTLMKLHYTTMDNRHQSVDVNQLAFGLDQCDPYLLLSLFRYARNTSIVGSITTEHPADDITISPTLNANLSVRTLTVSSHGQQVVYTFEY
jgi:YD repeat-containing protein